jgi:hypothetical protein
MINKSIPVTHFPHNHQKVNVNIDNMICQSIFLHISTLLRYSGDLKNLVRIECVTQSVTDVVDTQDGQKNHEPRDDGSPGSGKYLIERILEHVTPGRRRRLNAET